MTENIKKLLELVSGSEELKDKLNNATKETVITVAKEHGISLTDADFEANKSEISDEELCTVAGGRYICSMFGCDFGDLKVCSCTSSGSGG